MTNGQSFHKKLKLLIHEYVLLTYAQSKKYPTDEKYGLTSQDRRAAVSVMLNYIEGFARQRPTVMLNFYETSYASLKESIYCRFLAMNLSYLTPDEYETALGLKEQIAPMLYSTTKGLRSDIDNKC